MKKILPADELARDERFVRASLGQRFGDQRSRSRGAAYGTDDEDRGPRDMRLKPDSPNGPERARSTMHGIFMGEIQALEGAGRTCWDFDNDTAPYALKLDMARQCWDESRHVEISVKLCDWMGTEIGEFMETTFLYEAACNPDPVLRLTGVNRALEGLAIDVFNTMREFAGDGGDPFLGFAEDWMLADEVTHVKMGSDWLRRMTDNDPERRSRALEFQKVVDGLFSGGGFRRDDPSASIRLARRFRELAGFTKEEIDEIADVSEQAAQRGMAAMAAAATSAPANKTA